MKHVLPHPERQTTGRRYWRSLDDLADTPEFRQWLEREFPQGSSELELDPVSRRNFLRLMGASVALAGFGFSGCRRPETYLVPHSRGVEWQIPGKALLYSTAMPRPGGGLPLLVTTHDGRPTKIEGNPLHPESNGGTDVVAQASILDLYDPDRSRLFIKDSTAVEPAVFEEFLKQLVAQIHSTGGAKTAILAGQDPSPTRERLRRELQQKCPNLVWAEYEPLDPGYKMAAEAACFGPSVTVLPKIEAADVVLALDCDFLGSEPSQGSCLYATKAFSSRRRVPPDAQQAQLNRLYVVEPVFTITGGMADHRYACPAGKIHAFALEIAKRVANATKDAHLGAVSGHSMPHEFDEAWLDGVAHDLVAHKGTSLVVVGCRHSPELQTLVHALNQALGNLNKTVIGLPSENRELPATLAELASEIEAGNVETLFILGGNPAHNAPADLGWPDLQKKVKTVVRHGYYFDETSKLAQWHVPATHYLESWGDTRSPGGYYSIVQPMILPLFGGWSELDLLARLGAVEPSDNDLDSLEFVKATFKELFAPADFEKTWMLCLRDGYLEKSAPAPAPLTFQGSFSTAQSRPVDEAGVRAGSYEVVLLPDPNIFDGRYANNGWLQEIPDPVTKITWDNAAMLSPATARSLGVKDDDVLKIECDGRTLEIPAVIAPGTADNVIGVALGYGVNDPSRRVAHGAGVNASVLQTVACPYFLNGAVVTKTDGSRPLANTQEHHSMEGRDHFREGTVERFAKEPAFAKSMGIDSHIPPNISLYRPPPMTAPHQWGMTIDLNLCTGCNVCTVACQAENNIPIVGKEQVINGREMHWIRIDRYFASTHAEEPNPAMVMQPVTCVHCENAPCETVCPVNATVHNEEGLNLMVYNRCIGTRYCANNCPYKVRRFNYFDYSQRRTEAVDILPNLKLGNLYLGPLGAERDDKMMEMQRNPNVTVRMRGVIEKCTFCIQRLEDAKISHKIRNRGTANITLPPDTVKTACQQACPSQAITFGNLADKASAVTKEKASPRNYNLLEYLNVQPRVSYLARLKNPNPAMPDAAKIGTHNVGGHHAHDAHHAKEHAQGLQPEHSVPHSH